MTRLVAEGLLVLGHARRDTLTLAEQWEERKLLKHGDSIMRFFRPARGDRQNGSEQPRD